MKIISDMLLQLETEQTRVAIGAMAGAPEPHALIMAVGAYRGLEKAIEIVKNILSAEEDRVDNL